MPHTINTNEKMGHPATVLENQQHSPLNGRLLLLVFLVAFVARGGWGTFRMLRGGDQYALEFPDERDYWSLAESVARGDGLIGEHGFRALRMPLYPSLLSLFAHSEAGVLTTRILQWAIGAAAAVLTAMIGARIGGRPMGLVAGLLVAADPFLVFFASLLLTETLFITAQNALLLVSWPLLDRQRRARLSRWLAVGAMAAVCIYIRESSIVLCFLLTVVLIWRRGADRSAVLGGLAVLVIVLTALAPWALRNHRVTGSWCWLTHRGGISLYDGVGPQATGAGDLGSIKQMDAVRGMDEVAWNRYFLDASLHAIRDDPLRILRLAAVKIARTWNPVPNADTYQSALIRLVSAAWTIPVYLLAGVGALRLWPRQRNAVLVLLLPALWILTMHALFVGSVRYRVVAMPMLEVLAAAGLTLLSRRTEPPDRGSGLRSVP